MHACQTIISEEGMRALYGGIGATLLFQGPATAIYFGTYPFFTIISIVTNLYCSEPRLCRYEFVKDASIKLMVPEDYAPVVHLTAGKPLRTIDF